MLIYFGADHRGFALKNSLKDFVSSLGYQLEDLGNTSYDESDDYPDFASLVAKKIALDGESRGILMCGSGVGMSVVANKFPRVRAALAVSVDQIAHARKNDDVNILVLDADYLNEKDASEIVKAFLNTKFGEEERCVRRLKKVEEIESSVCSSL